MQNKSQLGGSLALDLAVAAVVGLVGALGHAGAVPSGHSLVVPLP
jgi:hypothetical protein